MYDHTNRMGYNYFFDTMLELEKNNLILNEKYSPLERVYFIRKIKSQLIDKRIHKDYKYTKEVKKHYVKNSLLLINKKIKEYFPDSKFIVLVYDDYEKNISPNNYNMDDNDYEILHSKDFWKSIEKDSNESIKIIHTEDLLNRTMNKKDERVPLDQSPTPHPTTVAWQRILPKFIKAANIK